MKKQIEKNNTYLVVRIELLMLMKIDRNWIVNLISKIVLLEWNTQQQQKN